MRNCIRFLFVAAAVAAALMGPGTAGADTVTQWNAIASTAIVATAGQTPQASALSFGMVQGAVYDAVNAIDGGHRPYLLEPPAEPMDSKDAAAATAAFRVLVGFADLPGLFPTQQPILQPLYDTSLAAIPSGVAKEHGIAIGAAAARAMLADRLGDGRGGSFTFPIGTAPGVWRPTPPNFGVDPTAWVAFVRPFLVPDVEMLRTDGPNPLTSAAYAKDFNEVRELGSLTSTRRTADQTKAAIFWQGPAIAMWNAVARSLVASHGLGIVDSARLFAMEDLAAADASIGCWNDKAHWNFWRPITAIHEADTDGNPATVADPDWKPLFDPSTPTNGTPLVTPPFPDHPSGHSCNSSAILHTLHNFFGTDKMAFDVQSPRFPGYARHFTRFSEALREIIGARVWGGIHFRTADEQGAVLGLKVAHYLKKHDLQPVR
jgi:hypothetical protein